MHMDCFGDSSDDENDVDGVIKRDASCGVCSFHPGTETSLLAHVRNDLNSSQSNANGTLQKATRVLEAIDEFCTSRHWMMHVGPEKGSILLDSLHDSINNKLADSSIAEDTSFVAVELGTYCGYASILIGRTFFELRKQKPMHYHLYTMEISREYAEIASKMIHLSGMEDLISVHQISYDGHDTNVRGVITELLREGDGSKKKIDFLFIDHDKDSYKSDLCKLEASGAICEGTKVVADNVLFACIDDYIAYVQQRQKEGIVKTRTIRSHVEYSSDVNSQPYEDGVGEFTLIILIYYCAAIILH